MKVERPNQVWATDITLFLDGARLRLSRCTVVDWFSRRVLSHRVSITMETGFSHQGSIEGGHRGQIRQAWEIFNSSQGGQFTSEAFTGVLLENEIAISGMDAARARGATTCLSSGSGDP